MLFVGMRNVWRTLVRARFIVNKRIDMFASKKNDFRAVLDVIVTIYRYEVYMDENGDAEGNYTLVSRQRHPNAAKGYGLFPAGGFTRLRNLTKNPVNVFFLYITPHFNF